jgi:hypothetical protein
LKKKKRSTNLPSSLERYEKLIGADGVDVLKLKELRKM